MGARFGVVATFALMVAASSPARAAAPADGGNADSGNADGGSADSGSVDGGSADGGSADGGSAADAGALGGAGAGGGNAAPDMAVASGLHLSCGGCSAAGADALGGVLPIALALIATARRRRRLVVASIATAARRRRLVHAASLALCCVIFAARASAGEFTSDSFGGRSYKLYVPSAYDGQHALPLVLMLHGCTQDPDHFATATQMNGVAEAHGFFALYPDQPSSAQSLKCWQWFDPAHQRRGAGEPAGLVALVDHVAEQYVVDGARTYVAGLSAGAAMSVILGATYPDRFAAITVAAGLEYAAATSSTAASQAQVSGGPDPLQQGKLAQAAMAGAGRPVRVLVIHGTQDPIVAPLNGDQVAAQWRATDALLGATVPASPDATEMLQVAGGRSYSRTRWGDWVQKLTVDGMGRAWPGGSASGAFTDAKGPDASELSWAFFAATAPSSGGAGGSVGAGAPGATPGAHVGCSFVAGAAPLPAGGSPGAGALVCLIVLLAAAKRATWSAWIRCSGSPSCSRKRG